MLEIIHLKKFQIKLSGKNKYQKNSSEINTNCVAKLNYFAEFLIYFINIIENNLYFIKIIPD